MRNKISVQTVYDMVNRFDLHHLDLTIGDVNKLQLVLSENASEEQFIYALERITNSNYFVEKLAG
jgi:hypothetical protein